LGLEIVFATAEIKKFEFQETDTPPDVNVKNEEQY